MREKEMAKSIAIVLIVLAVPDTALSQSLQLQDLRGYSISASGTRIESDKDLQNNRRFEDRTTFTEQIYISPTGRIFERLGYSNPGSEGQFDAVATENSQQLRFEPGFGFRRFNFDGGSRRNSTYVMVTSIEVHRPDVGFRCTMSIDYLLGAGESQYIKYIWNGMTLLVEPRSWSVRDDHCVVQAGNIFQGQTEGYKCGRNSYVGMEWKGSGLICGKR